jgi:hypothetical protein
MRTILLILFFGWLAVLMYCLEASRWIIAVTDPRLLGHLPRVPGGVLPPEPSIDHEYSRG